MRIGIDARFYDPKAAGLARYTTELIPRLLALDAAQKHQFVVFLPDTVDAPSTKHPQATFVRTGIKHYSLAEQVAFPRLLKKHALDLTHFLHFNHPLLWRGTSIFTIHDLILTFYPGAGRNMIKKAAYELTMRHALTRAAAIIAVSHTTKRQITEQYHTSGQKIQVVYEGVDARYKKCDNQRLLSSVQKRYGITKPYIVFVGQLRVHKNILRLIEAFASIHARDRSLQLVLVGSADARYLQAIKSQLNRLHLQRGVILTGFAREDDLPVLYSGAVCSVTPSLIEGFGLPPLEAMSCLCPVVCSNASCLPEIASDGALYFDPNNTVDMAEKLLQVIRKPALRNVLITAGQERIKAFSWDLMAVQTLALYLDTIRSRSKVKLPRSLPTSTDKGKE